MNGRPRHPVVPFGSLIALLLALACGACGARKAPATTPAARRLILETALATRLDVDRTALRPTVVLADPSGLQWAAVGDRPGWRRAEVPIQPGVVYHIDASVRGPSTALRVAVARNADGSAHLEDVPREALPGGATRCRTTCPAAQGDRMVIETDASAELGFERFVLREALPWSRVQLLNAADRDLRTIVTKPVSPQITRTHDAMLATGTSAFEWSLEGAGPYQFESEVTWVDRHRHLATPPGPLEVRVEARRGGRWEVLFRHEFSVGADHAHWVPIRVALGPADAVRLTTRPLAGVVATPTVAWAQPVIRPARRAPYPDIVLVSLDALRADELGVYGSTRQLSPNIDAAAALGTVFEEGRAQRGQTWESLTAFLSGDYPENVGVVQRGDGTWRGHDGLADRLARAGYATARIGDILMPHGHFGPFDVEEEAPGDARAFMRVLDFIRANPDRPTFVWVHVSRTHFPYDPNPPFRPLDVPLGDPLSTPAGHHEAIQHLDDATRDRLMRLYRAGVRESDAGLNPLFRELFRTGRPGGPAMVAVVADHGSHHGENGVWFMHSTLARPVLRVPYILAAPGRIPAGRRIDRLVRLMDIAPTFLDYLGLSAEGMGGASLRPLFENRPDPPRTNIVRDTALNVMAVETDQYKLIANPDRSPITWAVAPLLQVNYPVLGLYDWRRDPDERRNLTQLEPLIAGELYRLITAPRAVLGREVAGNARRLLQQAGYAEPDED
jgi:arylsulfatase A-like enzyme